MNQDSLLSRRRFLHGSLAGTGVLLLPGCSDRPDEAAESLDLGVTGDAGAPLGSEAGSEAGSDAGLDAAFPGVTPPCEETEDDPEGPFYTEGAPFRSNLVEAGMLGTRFSILGYVLGKGAGKICTALPGAVLDFWQADASGAYDNVGYTLRGRTRVAKDGSYRLDTIVPARYLNGDQYRPRHIHATVTAPGRASLTTQLYFPGDPYNAIDGMYKKSLLLQVAPAVAGATRLTRFDFVLA